MGDDGIILQLMHYLDIFDVMKFECGVFSCFSDERETLFFGGETVLRIQGICQNVGPKWLRYDIYMEAISALTLMMNGRSIMKLPISTNRKYQRRMVKIIRDLLRHSICLDHDAETPEYIQRLVRFHYDSSPNIVLLHDELLSEYK